MYYLSIFSLNKLCIEFSSLKNTVKFNTFISFLQSQVFILIQISPIMHATDFVYLIHFDNITEGGVILWKKKKIGTKFKVT